MMMVAVLSASAQYAPGKWSLQTKFGFGASQLTNMEKIPMANVTLDTKFKGAKMIGLEVEYQASKLLGISAGLTHTWQGTTWDDFTDTDNIKYKEPSIDLEYINVPVIANFYVVRGLALKAGFQIGYLVDADIYLRTESSLDGRDLTITTKLDMEKDCNKVDLSIPVGISYETTKHWVWGATYNIGLSKVNKESVSGEKDCKNGVFMLSFGYKFDL